jgi:hypothetical protein
MVWLSRTPDMLSLVAIGWCFLCAAAMAWIGFSAEMGALLASLTIGRMPIHSEILAKVLVVDFNLKNHARIRRAGMRVVYGDISNPETLRHCGLDKAKVVVLTLSSTFLKGTSSRKVFNVLQTINPDARFIGTASTARDLQMLMEKGACACISPEQEAAPAYLKAIQIAL